MEEFYTKIFVDAKIELTDLIEHVREVVGGILSIDTVLTNSLELDVKRNDLGLSSSYSGDEFLTYRYTVEVVSVIDIELGEYLEEVSKIMISLSELGFSVVAACDWEEQLPGRGRLCSYSHS
ncbi:hypothetical protein [Enterovibrio paralichthyis]|uniref:hypothetical protein n=1 Tax=Enterovibrio paralichthyis TaxID=2853805 RepID=UPI001C45C649|nr:hypothetical protein [Enterovibrio paralichthyis]MBV7297296.1 hypothetical protein [Enterovibrio paralichthyis]